MCALFKGSWSAPSWRKQSGKIIKYERRGTWSDTQEIISIDEGECLIASNTLGGRCPNSRRIRTTCATPSPLFFPLSLSRSRALSLFLSLLPPPPPLLLRVCVALVAERYMCTEWRRSDFNSDRLLRLFLMPYSLFQENPGSWIYHLKKLQT